MKAHEERVLAVRLTLGHFLLTEEGEWVRIAGLRLDGDEVVISCCDGRSRARVPVTASVVARTAGSGTDPSEERELDVRMVGWYPGDLDEVAHAVDEHEHPSQPAPTQRIAYGHPVPEFDRDEDLVGIYGGDLDHVADAFGAPTDVEARRRRQRAFKKGMSEHHHDGAPPEPEADDVLDEQIAGWYFGDLDSVVPPPHPEH